jgi:hypothetical protein
MAFPGLFKVAMVGTVRVLIGDRVETRIRIFVRIVRRHTTRARAYAWSCHTAPVVRSPAETSRAISDAVRALQIA